MKYEADIGIFGGSGFYNLLDDMTEVMIDTPYGAPSDKIALGTIQGKRVAFLPRHGKEHTLPPHKINYRANIWAMKQLGVTRILGPCAAGSLQPHIKPGDFVILDQFVNRTWGRKDTFFDGPKVAHVSPAEPYCPELRQHAFKVANKHKFSVHEKGTMVVINGPRFSTKAESSEFSQHGWDAIGMTQYPEGYLALEQEICYCGIALITDYDSGLEGNPDIPPVSHADVLKVFSQNIDKMKQLIFSLVESISLDRNCPCQHATKGSQ